MLPPRFIAVLGTLAVLASLGLVEPTHAQDAGIGVKIGPALTERKVDPGTTLTERVTVTNVTGLVETYTLTARNVSGVSDIGQPQFADGVDESGGLASWITLEASTATVGPNETKTLSYTVAVPPDASPGGHYGGVFVVRQADPIEGQGAGVGYEVGALLILTVSGEVVEAASIREFSTERVLYGVPEVAFQIKMHNAGTVHVRPQGIIKIRDMLDNEVGEVRVNTSGAALLPESERLFTETWTSDEVLFGRHKAILTIGYGSGAVQSIGSEISFWIIPWKQLGVVVGVALGVVLVLYGFMRYTVRRALRQAGHSARKVHTEVTLGARMAKTAIFILVLALLGLLVLGVFYS